MWLISNYHLFPSPGNFWVSSSLDSHYHSLHAGPHYCSPRWGHSLLLSFCSFKSSLLPGGLSPFNRTSPLVEVLWWLPLRVNQRPSSLTWYPWCLMAIGGLLAYFSPLPDSSSIHEQKYPAPFPAHAMLFRLFLTFIIHATWNAPFPAFALLPPSSEDAPQLPPPPGSLPCLTVWW